MSRLRRADCSGPGIRRVKRGKWLLLRRRRGQPGRGAGGARPHRRARHPAGLEGRLDLPVSDGPHPGDGHRRRRPQAVPLPPEVARAARPRKVRRHGRVRQGPAEAARGVGRAARGRGRAQRASACSPARCACSTTASSGSAPRTTRSPTRPTASRRCARTTSSSTATTRWSSTTPPSPGKRRVQGVVDPLSFEVVSRSSAAAAGGEELLAYKEGGRWRDVRSADINAFLKEMTGGDHSRQGLPHLERDAARRRRARRQRRGRRHQDGPQARHRPRGQGGLALPRQHARGVPRVLHRPARHRRLPGRRHHRAGRDRRRAGPEVLTIHQRAVERAVLRLLDGHEAGGRPHPGRGLVLVGIGRRLGRVDRLRRRAAPRPARRGSPGRGSGRPGRSGSRGRPGALGRAG